jgi:Kdo2-lipid IVA lauroyltransferase/acyltransferase
MLRLALFLLSALRFLPRPLLIRLGHALGLLFWAFASHRRHIARVNLRLCFPELGERERGRLLRAHFKATARSLLERGVLWWGSEQEVRKLVRLEGEEHIEALRGRPVIILAPHFVGLDMGGVRITLDISVASVYGPQRNKRQDEFLQRARNRFGRVRMISRKQGPRPILQALREGLPLYYLPDQDFGRRNAVFAPFFGIPASTLTALPRLANMAGATIVPCVTFQTRDAYVARFYPAWENYPSGDVEADTRRMNAFIEERVREHPEQYYWLHRRFKTRPEGQPSPYK